MSSFAVYVLVVDISEDLDAPIASSRDHLIQAETRKNDITTLSVIHFWLSVIYSHVGQRRSLVELESAGSAAGDAQQSAASASASSDGGAEASAAPLASAPKVLIVGTHRNSVH